MTAALVTAEVDPAERVLRSISARLRGPRRARADLLAELRDGLDDATDDLVASGFTVDEARAQAVAEFGDPAELAGQLQTELTGVQARRTAITVALISLGLHATWDWGYPTLMIHYALGGGHEPTGPAILGRINDLQSVVVFIAAPMLLLTYRWITRRTAPVRRIALGIGSLAAALLAVQLVLSGVMTALNPDLVVALNGSPGGRVLQFGTITALSLLIWSTLRTLRLIAFVPRVPHQE
jgi:hypothetical protein